mgnify:FL=1
MFTLEERRVASRKHGILHHSYSSLTLYRADPALWVARYLFNVKGEMSLDVFRGTCSEYAMEQALKNNLSTEEAVKVALEKFEEETKPKAISQQTFDPEKIEDTKNWIAGHTTSRKEYAGHVKLGLEELKKYGELTRTQEKIHTKLDNIATPIIGYKDFSFDGIGIDVDLKCTKKIPSEIPADHRIQGALYAKASGNRGQRFMYVSKDKCVAYDLDQEQTATAIRTATGIALALENFLCLSEDKNELKTIVAPDYANFRWSPNSINQAQEIFGF